MSFDLCNACRSAVPCRVWVGQNTPRSLWARKLREEHPKGGNACQLQPPLAFTNSSDTRRPSPPSTRRTLLGVRASTVVWDRPFRDIVAAQTLLQGVACWRFGFHFNDPMLVPRNETGCFRWPETLMTLDLGPRFRHDLSGVSLPAGLLELRLGAAFNRCVRGVDWPPRLRKLTFGAGFNKPIVGVVFPASLEQLSFGASFDQPLVQHMATDTCPSCVSWPPRLHTLSFGAGFGHDIGGGNSILPLEATSTAAETKYGCGNRLPASLKRLTLSEGFRQPVDTVRWPPVLEELRLGCVYISDRGGGRLAATCLPRALSRLSLDLNFHQSVGDVMPLLPDSLKDLEFGDVFNQCIAGIKWPSSLKRLAFGSRFNKPIAGALWPASLQHLSFGDCFDQPITGAAFPALLQHLSFGERFNRPISGVKWPVSLQELRMGRCFNQEIAEVVWPSSLRKLSLGKNFRQPIRCLNLPPDLLELELAQGCKQSLHGVRWPTQLRRVTVCRAWGSGAPGGVRLEFPQGCRLRRK